MNSQDDSTGATLAPHVDPSWARNLILELRLQGVSGQAVGAALSEVEAHVFDSGESALEAFGDPTAYARGLALPVSPAQTTRATLWLGVPVLAQVLGLIILAPTSISNPGSVAWSGGFLLGTAVLIAAIAAFVTWSEPVLRTGLRSPVLAATGAAIVVLATPLLGMAFPATALLTPSWIGWLVGASLLATGTLVLLVRRDTVEDHVLGPWTTRLASGRSAGAFGALAIPAVAVLVILYGLA